MFVSLYLAKIFGLLFIIFAIGIILNVKHYRKVTRNLIKDEESLFVVGFISTLIGLLLVNYHNYWGFDWYVLITIFGWMSLLKGLFMIIFPKQFYKQLKWFTNEKYILPASIVMMIVGFYLVYISFFS
ncbi:hypothetical protein HN958_02000 [Candidatus Falkowbacteria bacterium]|jgi:hypothetical protein|nr:hypothetical protein [Candidatus Falkowbacteria bacterium]MBT7007257.1 hypothetical protein [Candidatus Falkowbacteria bacterium]